MVGAVGWLATDASDGAAAMGRSVTDAVPWGGGSSACQGGVVGAARCTITGPGGGCREGAMEGCSLRRILESEAGRLLRSSLHRSAGGTPEGLCDVLIDGSTSCRGVDGFGGFRIRRSRRSPWGSGDLMPMKVGASPGAVKGYRWPMAGLLRNSRNSLTSGCMRRNLS